jgi:hypothetical protein
MHALGNQEIRSRGNINQLVAMDGKWEQQKAIRSNKLLKLMKSYKKF